MRIEWQDRYNFRCIENSEIKLRGYVDEERALKFTSELFEKAKNTLREIEGDPLKEKKHIQSQIGERDLSNFLIIRSIFDYGNIAPSWIFGRTLIDIYQATPHLFRPADEFWGNLLGSSKKEQYRTLSLPLLKLAGLFRISFSNFINYWISIVKFLRGECNNDASVFFKKMAEKL